MSLLLTKDQIRHWIAANPEQGKKRDIVKAFSIKGAGLIKLKRILRELKDEGGVVRKRRMFRDSAGLPPVTLLMVLPSDEAGDLFLKPMEWTGEDAPPRILLIPKKGDPALGAGDRILARLTKVDMADYFYEARLIRQIGSNPLKVLGVFRAEVDGGRIVPIHKGADKEWCVGRDDTLDARDGELVEAERMELKRLGLPQAKITVRLGDLTAPRAVSLIAIHQHGIPDRFPDAVIAEADCALPVSLDGREDLRVLSLVTIDPSDARDHDDAVFAEPDPDPANPGGHIVWVAIADVAYYVRPQSKLDREARKRGNSTYFPDRVVPMLPDKLSGDLCSLHEGVDRPCIAVRMKLDADGVKIGHRFVRGLMRSAASLNYGEVQAAADGRQNDLCASLVGHVIAPLYAAYEAIKRARAIRQPLELDLPERKIVLSEEGKVLSVDFRERLDAHKLIEEFMILANVAASEELMRLKKPLLFRVHEEPNVDKMDALREVAEASGFTLAKGQVLKPAHLNRLLSQAQGTEFDELLNISTLRSMTQAYYHPQNFGHFGLALRSYAHFTSPIRRYSDLIVHRALIAGYGWGSDGLSAQDVDALEETAKQISDAERRSMAAERDTTDRYLAAYLSDRVGAEFAGRISGVRRFGVFVKLDETGADGFIPIRELGREFFHYDEDSQVLTGADTGQTIRIGQRVMTRLAQAMPVTGGLVLELLTLEGSALAHVKGLTRRGYAPRKPRKFASWDIKIKRKMERKRR